MKPSISPLRGPVRLGTDIAFFLIVVALLLPNVMGLAGDAAAVKVFLLMAYVGVISTLLVLMLAAGAAIDGPVLAVAFFAAPYTVVVAAKGGGLTDALYMVTIMITVAVAAHLRSLHTFFVALGLLGIAFVIFSLGHWAMSQSDTFYRGLTPHKNALGTLLFFCVVGLVWAWRRSEGPFDKLAYVYAICACMVLMYFTRSRASMLTLALFLFFTWTWSFWSANRRRYYAIFTLVLFGSLLLVPAYVALSFSPYAGQIDQFALTLTGHPFFTGRNYVWPAYMLLFLQAPWWGHGFDTESLTLLKIAAGLSEHYSGLSAHNLYLMVVTQTGVIGLSALVFLLYGLWYLIYRLRNSTTGAVVGAMTLAYLVHEMLEVSLVQNNLIYALLFWIVIGASLRSSYGQGDDRHPHSSPRL